MTAVNTTVEAKSAPTRSWRRWAQRHGWTVGIWMLLVFLVVWYSTLIPRFGGFQFSTIINGGTAWIFLAAAQAVVVIAGGLDLGVGGLLVLTSATAAQFMDGQPLAVAVVMAVVILIGSAILNGIVGWVVAVSKVPDIVVTLGSLYIYQGLALMMLPKVGGGSSDGFRWLFTGSATGIGTNPWPAVVMITVPIAVAAWWMGRTPSGLSLYAVGSDETAAFLSGVNAVRTKIVSYAVAGAFVAIAGFSTLAIAGVGNATTEGGTLTLNSVAAVVLGGVVLTGGAGSLVAVVPAALILFFFNPILSALGVNPNQAQVIQGVLLVFVMAIAGLIELRRRRRS
ncbi:MAG: ABC transporter permease [Actinomycetota bacterium]|nr:ABC transporter permease [Actinomycetota bacterium]MDK1016524.1 ABC transporter permease [Actinomycetota bacterium]MDK1025889.1 ABC transporter permease [Actinomycetota bacterium]MDK1038646.1 ABC transporter permease [Actinomycetota bacterium]MDK1096667.1 ABC transporter permease [Actinomycetota bacterium]